MGFELLGILHLIQETTHDKCESTPRLACQWTRDIPNEFENGNVLTHSLVFLLSLGAPECERSGLKCASPTIAFLCTFT